MGRSSSRKSRTSTKIPTRTASQTPTRQASQMPTHPTNTPQGSTFGEAIKSGVGLGIGMEAVRGVTGMIKSSPSEVTNENPCVHPHNELMKCLNEKYFDCTEFLNSYNACLSNSK